jgi:hypothetical protein
MFSTSTGLHWARVSRRGIPLQSIRSRLFTHTPPSPSRHALPRVRTPQEKPHAPILSFREELARTSPVKSFSEQVKRPSIRNQTLVSICICIGRYVARNETTVYFSSSSLGRVLCSPLLQHRPTSTRIIGRKDFRACRWFGEIECLAMMRW